MSKLEHEVCLVSVALAYPLHIRAQRFCIVVSPSRRDVEADRRPPVWRAVVRPARSFFACDLSTVLGGGSAGVGKAPDDRHEGIEVDGLRHVQIEARVDRCFDIGARGVTRQRDRHDPCAFGEPPQLAHE